MNDVTLLVPLLFNCFIFTQEWLHCMLLGAIRVTLRAKTSASIRTIIKSAAARDAFPSNVGLTIIEDRT